MLGAFAKPIVGSLVLVASHASVPTLDIRQTCLNVSGSDGVQTCMKEELYARQKLMKYWSRTPVSDKEQCLLDPLPPYPSYIILRDCINNNALLRRYRHQS